MALYKNLSLAITTEAKTMVDKDKSLTIVIQVGIDVHLITLWGIPQTHSYGAKILAIKSFSFQYPSVPRINKNLIPMSCTNNISQNICNVFEYNLYRHKRLPVGRENIGKQYDDI